MKTINTKIMFLAIVLLPLTAYGQKKSSAEPSLVVGSDIAIVQTEYGKVRGFIHEGTYIYKGIPYVFVNGVVVVERGRKNRKSPGRVIRRPR